MARYKLNVLQFHATEDIAWRIEIPGYPQLTAPENMLRGKGLYYSVAEIRELMAYCRDRFIEFVPELDMPGHSAAFARAMKTDMQSDSGLACLMNILRVFCDTYDPPYLHIGGDEVQIKNKNFMPAIQAYLQGLGRKTIGWNPGAQLTETTIHQCWMESSLPDTMRGSTRYIDSRHLYINHYDPLEAVTTLFFRKLGNKEKGDSSLMGATLCLWHDRAVEQESDLLRMNPVYPSLLTFAERSWVGGGQTGWTATIGPQGTLAAMAFESFENRLLDQQRQYFSDLPFPYARQSDLIWNLYGPYENGGDLSQKMGPEKNGINPKDFLSPQQVVGGTIILRHWWAPAIRGALAHPHENTTCYAGLRFWSEREGICDCWIGMYNLSRSPATDSPPAGAWDNRQSKIWINGNLVDPPHWKHPGQKGNLEIPLSDEGYEYRAPGQIHVQQGWNTVLIKAPVGSFKGDGWQNPVKWMFSFVPLGLE